MHGRVLQDQVRLGENIPGSMDGSNHGVKGCLQGSLERRTRASMLRRQALQSELDFLPYGQSPADPDAPARRSLVRVLGSSITLSGRSQI